MSKIQLDNEFYKQLIKITHELNMLRDTIQRKYPLSYINWVSVKDELFLLEDWHHDAFYQLRKDKVIASVVLDHHTTLSSEEWTSQSTTFK